MGSQLLGNERVYLKGIKFDLFVSGDTKPIFGHFIAKVFQSDKKESCEVELSIKGHAPVCTQLTGILTEDRKTCLLTATDITARKHAEIALIENEHRVRAKLDALLLPDGDIGHLELEDIIDVKSIQVLMDDFYSATKMGVGIIDLNGKVIVRTGWQNICTNFHRANPDSCRNCIESDLVLTRGIEDGKSKIYKCKNNMWDVSTPIFIGNKLFGNIFLGQFFFKGEEPDLDLFRWQAKKFGFDEIEYLNALACVPRWERAMVGQTMNFYSKLSSLISTLSFSNVKLVRLVEDLNKAKQELIESDAVLRKINLNNDKLFSIIAHDLRSPFNGILGFSEILFEEYNDLEPDEVKEYAKNINTSARSTLNLLDNLLTWAKAQSGQVSFNRESLLLEPIIMEITDVLKLNAAIKNISLNHLSIDGIMVFADRNMLETIIRNLVSNAIKFTNPCGRIDINAVQNADYVKVSIADNGVGMSEETCKKLFLVNSNMTSKGTVGEKGSGLGLLLCKEFVDKHGGKIWAESEEGLGSTFHFTLPYK
jgi:signal transduction histidine kinase